MSVQVILESRSGGNISVDAEEKKELEEYLKKNQNEELKTLFTDIGAALLAAFLGGDKTQAASYNQPGSGSNGEINSELSLWMKQQMNDHESFQSLLLKHLEKKGYKDRFSDFYKKIYLDRRLFSKLATEAYQYHPEKKTVFKLIFGLELTMDEAQKLLLSAGYSFNSHQQYDMIIKYCIEKGIYKLEQIDEYLQMFSEKPLFFA